MKICNHCSQILENETQVCPHCGWNQAAAEQPAAQVGGEQTPEAAAAPTTAPVQESENNAFSDIPTWNVPDAPSQNPSQGMYAGTEAGDDAVAAPAKSKLPLVIGIGVIAVAIIAAAVYFILPLFQSAPQKFVSYQKKFVVDQMLASTESAIKEYNSASDFSGDINISAELEGNAMLSQYLNGTSIDLKLKTGKDSVLMNLNMNLMGSQILEGLLSYKDGVLGFALPELDDNYYTLDLEKFAKKNGIDSLESLKMPEISTDTLASLGKVYSGIILGTVNESNLTLEKDTNIELPDLDKTVKGDLYIFKPTATDIEHMIAKLADTIEQDQTLRDFILSFMGDNINLFEEFATVDQDAGGNISFADELDNYLKEIVDEMRKQAEEIGQSVESSGFRWVLGVSGEKIVLQSIDSTDGSGFTYEANMDGKNENAMAITVQNNGITELSLRNDWKIDGSNVTGSLSMDASNFTSLTGEYSYDTDRKSKLGMEYGEYSFIIDSGSEKLNFAINVQDGENGTDHILSISGDMLLNLISVESVKLNIHASDKESTAVEPTGEQVDITDYSEEDLQALLENLYNTVGEDIMGKVFASAGAFG